MLAMKAQSKAPDVFDDLIVKAKDQLTDWNEKLQNVCELIKKEEAPKFHEIQDFISNRLTSNACSKNQGYVMNSFELDSEMASFLFRDESNEDFEFNSVTKPDFVILMNRVIDQDDLCVNVTQLTVDEPAPEKSEKITKLHEY